MHLTDGTADIDMRHIMKIIAFRYMNFCNNHFHYADARSTHRLNKSQNWGIYSIHIMCYKLSNFIYIKYFIPLHRSMAKDVCRKKDVLRRRVII